MTYPNTKVDQTDDCGHDFDDHNICLECGYDRTEDVVAHAEFLMDRMRDAE